MNTTHPLTFRPFALGLVGATPAALDTLERLNTPPAALLVRHLRGDWGDLDAEDRQANTDATHTGERLLSAYPVNGERLWVITEADRSATTILLPDEY